MVTSKGECETTVSPEEDSGVPLFLTFSIHRKSVPFLALHKWICSCSRCPRVEKSSDPTVCGWNFGFSWSRKMKKTPTPLLLMGTAKPMEKRKTRTNVPGKILRLGLPQIPHGICSRKICTTFRANHTLCGKSFNDLQTTNLHLKIWSTMVKACQSQKASPLWVRLLNASLPDPSRGLLGNDVDAMLLVSSQMLKLLAVESARPNGTPSKPGGGRKRAKRNNSSCFICIWSNSMLELGIASFLPWDRNKNWGSMGKPPFERGES